MTARATGTFDVKVSPATRGDNPGDTGMARYTLEKQFHGDMQGTSIGEMLAADTQVKGSGAYVALERVTGTLSGRRGTFVLQHNGTMARGEYSLSVTVVPDSGTEQLVGLTGKMGIVIAADGTHSYEFNYALPRAD